MHVILLLSHFRCKIIEFYAILTLPQLAGCTALRYLRLRENLLEDLPGWFGSLTALQQLDLVGNRLKTLSPELVKRLTNLTSLALSEYVVVVGLFFF